MKTIQLMFEHSNWANERLLLHLQNAKGNYCEVIELFAHILHAEQVWLCRLKNTDSSHIQLWGNTSLERCEEQWQDNKIQLEKYIQYITEKDMEKVISYQNSKGKEFQSTVGEILTHLCLHGQYHRGQINKKLREMIAEPINVDFITYARKEY